MKSKMSALVAMLVTLSLTTLTQAQNSARSINTDSAAISHWAEDIYNKYAAATGGKLAFHVETLEKDQLTRLAGIMFSDILAAPSHRVLTTQIGTQLRDPQFYAPDDPAYGRQEMSDTADKFSDIGYAVSGGTYRKLEVRVTINGETRQHEALEFCFPAQLHCALLDPVVVFLQSKVENLQRLAAAGWAPRTTYNSKLNETADIGTRGNNTDLVTCVTGSKHPCGGGGTCGLASNPKYISESLTWPAYTVTYTNLFGITMVQFTLGQQVAGMSCTTSCTPAPFAQTSASSSFANFPYSTACANDGASGTTGSSGKGIAQTECTYQLALSATGTVSVGSPGTANVTLNFVMSPSGGVSSNGGSVYDTCGYF